MCGITLFLIFNKNKNNSNSNNKNQESPNTIDYNSELLNASRLIRHRGPDWNGKHIIDSSFGSVYMGHERLSIIDPKKGSQPIIYNYTVDGQEHSISLCVNGEIYNYKELKELWHNYNYQTESDCEVIIAGYIQTLEYISKNLKNSNFEETEFCFNNFINFLNGQFSFVLYDSFTETLLVGRDPIGITSLYYGFDKFNNLMFSSELKGLYLCETVNHFPNGHYLKLSSSQLPIVNRELKTVNYFQNTLISKWLNLEQEPVINEFIDNHEFVYKRIRQILTKSVKKRLMADVPFGVLLSGGLDSSLVSSITVNLIKSGEVETKWGDKIHSFSIGLEGLHSTDLEKAQEVAEFLGTIHHNFTFTIQEGLDALKDVIYHLETYDITTVRASTPMYLLSRKIKAMGVKMVLSGEGSDELLGGYLYFLNAPNDNEFFLECKRRVKELSFFDCMRANKSTLAWGLESRVPFLDTEFIDLCFEIPSKLKRQDNIEKYVLRKAFDVNNEDGTPFYLPKNILWRQKEQFGDGVGYGWIDSVRDLGEKSISDELFSTRATLYPHNTPPTKEAFMYRQIFEKLFPNRENNVKMWIPKTEWEGVNADPSGRAQQIHNESYD